MRTHRLMAILAIAVLSQACSPEEAGLLTPRKTTGTTSDQLGGEVGNGEPTPAPETSPAPTPSPTPVPVLKSLAIVPSSFNLSSDPMASFDQRAQALALVATMSDQRQVSTTAVWTASPPGRISVSAAGYVQVVPNAPAGPVTITASSGSITAQAIATITTKPLTVTYVELLPTSLSLYKQAANGTSLPEYPSKAQLTPTVVMSDQSTTSAVTWVVSDPSIATVSLTGLVTALGSGSCVIEARSTQDPLKKATCELTVSAKGAVSVTLE